jgi:hypothetical protein
MMHWRQVPGARRCNFAKSAAIFQKPDEGRFSKSVTSALSVRGGVENINARGAGRNSDPVETLRAKRSNPRRVLCKPIKLSTSAPIAP